MHKIKLFLFFIFLVFISLITSRTVYTEIAPPEARNAQKVLERSQNIVDKFPVNDLIKDAYFINRLKQIINSSVLNDDEKVDAFYLMLKKIKWSFSGIVIIPPRSNYFNTYKGFIGTYFYYQKELKKLNYNVSKMLFIAKKDYKTNVVHSSNALLLAALLDPKTTKKQIEVFLKYETIMNAQVPDILLHHVCLASVLTKDLKTVSQLANFLNKDLTEEGSEDVLCTMGIFTSKTFINRTIRFLKNFENMEHDLTAETAMVILRKRLDENDFQKIMAKLLNTNIKLKKIYEALRNNKFITIRKMDEKNFYKSWDDFDIVIYEDGMLIKYKNKFADFF
ncbi:MAG: hypothetical protein KAI43_07785 [Candidatus Aureabacteria bacterium]|nr:hypothetical protein [Candidatus Auribacterota bacterium]